MTDIRLRILDALEHGDLAELERIRADLRTDPDGLTVEEFLTIVEGHFDVLIMTRRTPEELDALVAEALRLRELEDGDSQ